MSNANNTAVLPDDVAKEFELVDWTGSPKQFFGRFGNVDVRTLTVKKAERLITSGFKKLRKKVSTPAAQAKALDTGKK